jgi:hypothetical protein
MSATTSLAVSSTASKFEGKQDSQLLKIAQKHEAEMLSIGRKSVILLYELGEVFAELKTRHTAPELQDWGAWQEANGLNASTVALAIKFHYRVRDKGGPDKFAAMALPDVKRAVGLIDASGKPVNQSGQTRNTTIRPPHPAKAIETADVALTDLARQIADEALMPTVMAELMADRQRLLATRGRMDRLADDVTAIRRFLASIPDEPVAPKGSTKAVERRQPQLHQASAAM